MELTVENIEKFVENKILYQDLGKMIKNKLREHRKWIPFNSSKVNNFYRDNNIFLERNSSENFKWDNGTKERFYDVIVKNPLKDELIKKFNEEYSKYAQDIESENGNLGISNKTLIQGLNYIEEIDKFTNAYQYESEKNEILNHGIKLLMEGNLKGLKKLSGALNNDIDVQTILAILNSDNLEESLKTLDLEKIVKEVENEKDTLSTTIGGLITASTAIILSQYDVCINFLTDFSKDKINEKLESAEKAIKFLENHFSNYYDISHNYFNEAINYVTTQFPSVVNLDKVALGATAVGIIGVFIGGKITGAVFKNYYEGRKENKVGVMDINKCNEDNYKFFTKYRLINGITKHKEFKLDNIENKNHVILMGFLIDKLEDPSKQIADYVNQSGISLKTILGLSDIEEQRLNSITQKEIASISQISNPQIRDVMMKNKFSLDDLLLAREVDNLQKIYGLKLLEKGNYFKEIDRKDIAKQINNKIDLYSPLKKMVVKNYLRNLADKDNQFSLTSNNDYRLFSEGMKLNKLNTHKELISEITKGFKKNNNKNDTLKDMIAKTLESKSKYHNSETREFINQQFDEMKFNCAGKIDSFAKLEDGALFRTKTIVKNVTKNMINKLRSTFHSGSSTTPGTP